MIVVVRTYSVREFPFLQFFLFPVLLSLGLVVGFVFFIVKLFPI